MDRIKLTIENLRAQLGLEKGEELTAEKLSFLGHVSTMISTKNSFFKIQEANIISVHKTNNAIKFIGIENYYILPLDSTDWDDDEEPILTVRD